MDIFEQVSRPVLYEHLDPEYSYWGKGSSMLLSTQSSFYWVTARHVLENMEGTVESLRIFPYDYSTVSLPFNEKYTIKPGTSLEDYKDVFVLRIHLDEFLQFGDCPLVGQDVNRGLRPAEQLCVEDRLWIIGYPEESNSVDYEERRIKNTRSVIGARYMGQSTEDHCHTLRFDGALLPSSLDGLSGSPIFYLQPESVADKVMLTPLIIGMLLRGSSESRRAHFVSSRVLGEVIRIAEADDA